MKKFALVLLTSPMFLTFMLLGNSAVHAEELANTSTNQSIVITRAADPASTQVDAQNALFDSDHVGDLAISKRGCDCSGCRNVVIQMVSEGKLVLPQ